MDCFVNIIDLQRMSSSHMIATYLGFNMLRLSLSFIVS